jgi:hypothetical protein
MQYIFLNQLQLPMHLHRRNYDLQQQLLPEVSQRKKQASAKLNRIAKYKTLEENHENCTSTPRREAIATSFETNMAT